MTSTIEASEGHRQVNDLFVKWKEVAAHKVAELIPLQLEANHGLHGKFYKKF